MVDENNILQKITVGDGYGYMMSGISYWTRNDAAKIIDRIDEIIEKEDYTNLFWDNAVIDVLPMLLSVEVKEVSGIFEIDTEMELREVEKLVNYV